MSFTGEKLKLVNALDNQFADELQPLYSIDIILTQASKTKVKCGAITVFKMNLVDMKLDARYDITKTSTSVQAEIERAREEASRQTEFLYRDPILFKETEGRWINWAVDHALQIFDDLGSCARISIKCPKLKIEQRRSARQVMALRHNPRELFSVALDIDRLLSGNFNYDPWNNIIRRGSIDAASAKRVK